MNKQLEVTPELIQDLETIAALMKKHDITFDTVLDNVPEEAAWVVDDLDVVTMLDIGTTDIRFECWCTTATYKDVNELVVRLIPKLDGEPV